MENKRVCYIEVQTNDNGTTQMKSLEGMAIKGKVIRKAGTIAAEATLSIANLTQSDIEYLTTYTSPYMKPKVKKLVNIYAGYSQSGWGRIFQGDITEAIPEGMPDTWLNIKAQSQYYNQRSPISYGVTNTTSKEIAQSIANNLGLTFDWQATSEKNIDIFDFIGSKAGLIKEFNKLDDVTMFEDNGTLKVVDKVSAPPDKNQIPLITKDSGLIGLPEPDQYGVKFKCLLSPALIPGQWIRLESVKLTGLNGQYQIYTVDFDFESRGQAFYCDIYAKTSGV